MTLNDQQQKSKKQGESKHPDRKVLEKNDSRCNEKSKSLEKHRNKTISSPQNKTSDIKKKTDTLNYQKKHAC